MYVPGPLHTTQEKFKNGGFTLKTHQMFSVHTTLKEFENITITSQLDFCLRKTRAGKSRDSRNVIISEKLRFKKGFHLH